MKKIILRALLASTILSSCSKSDSADNSIADFNTAKDAAITDFVNKVALPAYGELKAKGETLNNAVTALNTTTNEANLLAARNAWKDMRSTWEKCEGFLFGPVDQDEYDPETDTWPVNFNDMNNLLNSTQPLTISDIDTMSRSLKGYHPIEYILWGLSGTATAASLTTRQKEYIVSLSHHLKTQADNLYNSWISSGGNYSNQLLSAGKGSTLFLKKQDAFIAIVDGLSGICGEVGDGKMKEPFDLQDPNIVESPFSGNSTTDFKNNILGAYNVYLGRFNVDGAGLEELVKAKNASLDVTLQEQFNAAIASFNSITVPYEQAIISQRTQCQATMNAINALAETIETKLRPFIIQYITD